MEMLQKHIWDSDISPVLKKLELEGCFEKISTYRDYIRFVIKYVMQEGEIKGEKKGELKNQFYTAKVMLDDGVPRKKIKLYCKDLSDKDIDSLLRQLKQPVDE